MRINKFVMSTTVDGIGMRNSVYTQGCPIRCKGCHNSELWDVDGGEVLSIEEIAETLTEGGAWKNVSILGGEPLAPFQSPNTIALCKLLKEKYSANIWLYTGYTLEQLQERKISIIFSYIDYLVEGPYIEEKRFDNGIFRGSSNQRILKFLSDGKTYIDMTNKFDHK